MKNRLLLGALFIGGGLGLVGGLAGPAILVAWSQGAGGWTHVEVVAWARDLPPGTVLAEGDLLVVPVSEKYVADSWVPVADRASLLGRTLERVGPEGQPVMRHYLVSTGRKSSCPAVE